MTIQTTQWKWQFLELFIEGPPEDDGEGNGFVNMRAEENSLFARDGFRIVENVTQYDKDMEYENPILAIQFEEGGATKYDGHNIEVEGEEDIQGFFGNDFVRLVTLNFIVNEDYDFTYNGNLYKVPRLDDPQVEHDLNELVFWWLFKIINENLKVTKDDVEWQIFLEQPDFGWIVESIRDFGRDAKGVGFTLTFTVKFEIKVRPFGG